MPVYLVLQPARGTASDIAAAAGGLLPHLFTLTALSRRGGCSLLPCCPLAKAFPLGRAALCVARTFLSPPQSSSDDSLTASSDKAPALFCTKLTFLAYFPRATKSFSSRSPVSSLTARSPSGPTSSEKSLTNISIWLRVTLSESSRAWHFTNSDEAFWWLKA